MGIALGNIGIIDIRIGYHRLINQVQIDHHFGGIFSRGIGGQSRLFARLNLGNPVIGDIYKALQHAGVIFHALIDHHLNPVTGNFQRADQGGIF